MEYFNKVLDKVAQMYGYDSFETQLNSRNNPIALDRSSWPYRIINGRHRVFLARQKGYSSIPAEFV